MTDDARFAELISKIAHELRSPLTSVKGFSATLLKRWDRFTDEQRLEFIETIHKDAERMGRIVSEVLDLARLEAGRLELSRVPVEVGPIARRAAEHLSELPGAERVSVEVPDGLVVHADAARLEHVIFNLLENGVKFSDEGPIELRATEDGRGSVEITVTDSGVGIEPDRLDDVFDGPAAKAQKATPSGSGLGLYLSKKLTEAHGGSLTARSEPGQGSTFVVVLPPRDDQG
ncbi:MAG: HAMP domain-containing histidine kinase [Actinomycetota bacterium]|nr:HAMP domain-containing histidine kinase [Actinomycetota bacterium]